MEKRKKKTLWTAVSLLDIVLIAVLVTWAWIEGTVNPGLQGSNMQISAAPGLIMKIDGAQTNIINLNEYCSDNRDSSITLAEASSADGKKIYFRNVSEDTTKDDTKVYLKDMTLSDINTNYLSVTFTLTAANGAQTIWIDPEQSYIKNKDGESLEALRLSLEVKEMENGVPSGASVVTILGMREPETGDYCLEKGVADFDKSNNLMEDDAKEGGVSGTYMKYVQVYPLQGYSSAKPWLRLDQDETVQVTMRVWLEGMDEECVDSISGNSLILKMFFDARDPNKSDE